jgi:uncharacterized ferritin-like protein (DUF455 family)
MTSSPTWAGVSMAELFQAVEATILECSAAAKCEQTAELRQRWQAGELDRQPDSRILPIDDPGRPPRPVLVDPRKLERRSVATPDGRLRLLHAFAHIEFNAINIALDAVYRFRDMPEDFISDWLRVASEEAFHFSLLQQLLQQRGSDYGAYSAHRGLWDMVCKTRDDALHRMALVPRVMEARGLDVTPGMIDKFRQVGDLEAVQVLQQIYRDEIGHVRIGNHWYAELCRERQVNAEATFLELVERYMGGKLRGPFNRAARIEAGFGESELASLERLG